MLTGGFANVDMAILGKEAKKKFFADANVQKMMDNRRMNMGEINPRDLPNGVKYLGHLTDPSLDLYAYGEVYYDDWIQTRRSPPPSRSFLTMRLS